MSSDEEERILKKQIFKNPVEVQRARLDRLMKNVEKTVFIPEPKQMKPPRAFQPHEFVRNVMGASAGAGSGEFDIYRGCRRRQMIREAYLSREAKEREANAEWLKKVDANKQKAETQTAKRRKKRMKRKENAKTKKGSGVHSSNKTDESSSSSSEDEHKETTDLATNTSDIPVANTAEKQMTKERTPSPTSNVQQHERVDIRKHLRHRKASSSDDDGKEKTE